MARCWWSADDPQAQRFKQRRSQMFGELKFMLTWLIVALVIAVIFAPSRRSSTAGHTCRHCGAAHPPFARFCRRCGKKL
jgi:hypothetical protein